jgi:hypothetical protein
MHEPAQFPVQRPGMLGIVGSQRFFEAALQRNRKTVVCLQEDTKISRQSGKVFQAVARGAIVGETEELRWISDVVRAVTIDTVHNRLCTTYSRVAAPGVQSLLIRMAAPAEPGNFRGPGRSIKTRVGGFERERLGITAVAAGAIDRSYRMDARSCAGYRFGPTLGQARVTDYAIRSFILGSGLCGESMNHERRTQQSSDRQPQQGFPWIRRLRWDHFFCNDAAAGG